MMNATTRSWCPSLYEPMQSGDGLLVRIKPSASRLDAASARAARFDGARPYGFWRPGRNSTGLLLETDAS
ncbi:MAG: hypothetical protein ACRYGI_01755 [Janthinobacterium lividum]